MAESQPSRWTRPDAPLTEDEVRLGKFLRAGEAVPALSPTEVARIQQALDVGTAERTQIFRSRGLVFKMALACAGILLTAQLSWAMVERRWPLASLQHLFAARAPGPTQTLPPTPAFATLPVPALSPPSDDALGPDIALSPESPRTAAHVERGPAAPGALAREAAKLAPAQQALAHDPAGALRALEDYRHRYPRGALGREADLTEISADLSLHRPEQALAILDKLSTHDFAGVARAAELRLLRAELEAKQGQCTLALPEFARSLSAVSDAGQRQRGLYGQARCYAETGDLPSALKVYDRYLWEFPKGRYAAAARAALGQGD